MTTRVYILLALGTLCATAITLLNMGRVPFCTCGTISLWTGTVNGPENSQQIADWYTASHFIHGILFFALFSWLLRKIAPRFVRGRTPTSNAGLAFLLAVIVECAWEILENSPIIIDRYREATLAVGYMGDSVLNSVSDILFMALGFVFARRAPVWFSVLLVIFLELFVGYMIRDNLTLNIIMLIYPIDSIRIWQGGA